MANPIAALPWFNLFRSAIAIWRFAALGTWILTRRTLGSPPPHAQVGRQLREVLQLMGVTYVKLGQFLAIRFDLLHPDMARELSNLFDAVPPAPGLEIRAVIETEFGEKVEGIFAEFEWD